MKDTRMASLGQATSRTTGLVVPAVLVMVGSYAATVATDWMSENVYDPDIRGGDAAHPLIAVFALNMLLDGETVRFVSLGMLASSASEVGNAYGLI